MVWLPIALNGLRQLYFPQIPATWEHTSVTSNSLPRVFALAPGGIAGVAMAAAACRANALGLIDFASGRSRDFDEAFDRIGKLTARPFGVRTLARDVLSGDVLKFGGIRRPLPSVFRYGQPSRTICPSWSSSSVGRIES